MYRLFLFLLIPIFSFCQDSIFFNNQTNIESKIIKIKNKKITYEKDGIKYTVLKDKINHIIYSNGDYYKIEKFDYNL